ncbi:acyltransferase family protein [Sphingomonas abietis]|uniref:Acyltransferase n=1 Tax=Sphingomonas abietis TaxID=3012344 RepID=A0ABY7NP97_9SPHN|nr:acyltransferase [Sphingomonas abietis]WBO23352.1 acyltransferase [Sphingomonas abietis]
MRAEKRVFLTLDGLRGVAAIMIVLFHSRAIVGHFYPASAYLSVDLFFALSGCVLEASYRERLAAGLSTREFMTIRFIRLWPMFALSLPIGLAFAVMRMNAGFGHDSGFALTMAMVSGLLLLPTPLITAKTFVMPLNAAGWSLVLELAINALYARCWRWLSNRLLWGVVAVAGIVLAAMSIYHGGVDMGSMWGTVAGGLVRVTYSFTLGVLIFRTYDGWVWRGWAGLLPPLALIPILATWRGGLWFDLLSSLALLPLLVWAGLRLEPGRALGRLFRWGGLISYALYAMHGPVIRFVHLELLRHLRGRHDLFWIGGLAAIAALILLSAALDRWYDAPLRRRLSQWLLYRRDRRIRESAMTAP